jgi:hypothetical protein
MAGLIIAGRQQRGDQALMAPFGKARGNPGAVFGGAGDQDPHRL